MNHLDSIHPKTLMGKHVIWRKSDTSWEIRVVQDIDFKHNKPRVKFKKSSSKRPLSKKLKSMFKMRSDSEASLETIYPLIDVYHLDLNSSDSEVPSQIASYNYKKASLRSSDGKYFWNGQDRYDNIELDDLKIGDQVVWFPDGKAVSTSTLNIGEVKQIGIREDVQNKSILMAEVVFKDYNIEDIEQTKEFEVHRDDNSPIQYRKCVNLLELCKVGEGMEMLPNEISSQAIEKPKTLMADRSETFEQTACLQTDLDEVKAIHPCLLTRRKEINCPEFFPGQTICKFEFNTNNLGIIKTIFKAHSGEMFIAAEFEQTLREDYHDTKCRRGYGPGSCSRKLLIPISMLSSGTDYKVFPLLDEKYEKPIPDLPSTNNSESAEINMPGPSKASASKFAYESAKSYENDGKNKHPEPEKELRQPVESENDFRTRNLDRILQKRFSVDKTSDGICRNFGIQGDRNSCYVDSSMFAMFSFSKIFDEILNTDLIELLNEQDRNEPRNSRRFSLALKSIVTELRSNFYVPSSSVMKLRYVIAEHDPRFLKEYMDAEDFLLVMFKELEVSDFMQFDNGASDTIHQIVVPDQDGKMLVKEVKTLIADSLWFSEVKITQVPRPAFILKLPFCDGKPLYGSKYVIPNLRIDLQSLTTTKDSKSVETMDLIAILCLKSSHYVCFVKTGEDDTAPWVYFDSDPVKQSPKVELLPNLGQDLLDVENYPSMLEGNSANSFISHPDYLRLIFSYCYICVYAPCC